MSQTLLRDRLSIQHSALRVWVEVLNERFQKFVSLEKGAFAYLGFLSLTEMFPKQEMYGLTSQIRRCAASIAANIAEGCGKHGNPEFQRFLNIAAGSASELEYHFLLSKDLGFLSAEGYQELHNDVVEVKRMLASLTRKLTKNA